MTGYLRIPVYVACAAMMGACTVVERMHEFGAKAQEAGHRLQARHDAFRVAAADPAARRRAQHVNRPWIAGKALPLAREVTLPPALRADVTTTMLFSDGPLELPEIARRITAVTRIPVHVRPEALLPVDTFMPRLGAVNQSERANRPAHVHLAGHAEPLARILDRIGAALEVFWSYRNGRIEFYRTQTRVFNVKTLTMNAETDASLGLHGISGTEGGFSSASQTRLRSHEADFMDIVRARIEPFLTRAGVVSAPSGAGGTIVVTDTPDVLNSIAQYLEAENRVLSRRIRLIFEEITLAMHDNEQAGLDWNVVFSNARMAAMASMGGGGTMEAGLLSMGLTQGPFGGSDAMLAALSRVGTVVRRSSVPVLTLNRRPVTHAVRTTFSYIDKVDTTAYGGPLGVALPSVSVSQKEETVGTLLTLVPDAQDDGRIFLSIAYDNTVAQPIKTIRVGSRDHPLELQQVSIDGNGTVQQVVLEPGQPVLISGFDRSQEETERERPAAGLPLLLGGSNRVSGQQLVTVMMVTAQVEEGV